MLHLKAFNYDVKCFKSHFQILYRQKNCSQFCKGITILDATKGGDLRSRHAFGTKLIDSKWGGLELTALLDLKNQHLKIALKCFTIMHANDFMGHSLCQLYIGNGDES